jgi:broad specificity phosphatase PhoE
LVEHETAEVRAPAGALTLFVIRHGESEWNHLGLVQGQRPVAPGLTELGREQAREVGLRLVGERLEAVISSDLLRAVETAEAVVAACGGPLELDVALRERAFGPFEGRPSLELRDAARAVDPDHRMAWRPGEGDEVRPGSDGPSLGESAGEVGERVRGTLDRLWRPDGPRRLGIVTHGGVIRVLRSLIGADLDEGPVRRPVPNADVEVVEWPPLIALDRSESVPR